jgi:formiminoglutamase
MRPPRRLAQKNYLAGEAPPFEYDPARAERLRVHLRAVLERLQAIAKSRSSARS